MFPTEENNHVREITREKEITSKNLKIEIIMGTLVNGIKEIFATAKTTGSNVMLCGNDGTPDGHMTMDNLASVLGALFHMFNYTYEIQSGEQQIIKNTYLGAVVFCTSSGSGKTYVMQIPYYTAFEETYGEELKVKRPSHGSSAVIENIYGSTTTLKLMVFGMDF